MKQKKDARIRDLVVDYGVSVENAKEMVEFQEQQEREFSVQVQRHKEQLEQEVRVRNREKLAEIIRRKQ
jgi:YbbR domain-containing protein